MSGFRPTMSFNTAGSPLSSSSHEMMSVHQDLQHQTPSSGGAFLPNFLLGSTVAPPAHRKSMSNTSFHGSSPPASGYGSFSNHNFASAERQRGQKRVSPLLHNALRDKSSHAPPVQGLYENGRSSIDDVRLSSGWELTPSKLRKSYTGQSIATTPVGSSAQFESASNTSVFSPRPDNFAQSPAQLDPFYTQGESLTSLDVLDETWVTIFGFPPSLVAYILEQFSQYGTIEQKEILNNVNWLHIKYQTKLQAKKALSKNGKTLNGNIMIGVCQCIDKEVMDGKQQEMTCYKSVLGTPTSAMIQSPTAKPSSIRPLTAAYQAAASQNKVVQEGKGTPKRNNSVVSKTLEYVFGW